MHFDPALAAQAALKQSGAELGSDWPRAMELEDTFSSNAGLTAREAYNQLLELASRYPDARAFQAFCIYITWQQVTEDTIALHFRTGMTLCERYLADADGTASQDTEQISELYESFKAGLGLAEEDDIQVEFRRDTPKGGD